MITGRLERIHDHMQALLPIFLQKDLPEDIADGLKADIKACQAHDIDTRWCFLWPELLSMSDAKDQSVTFAGQWLDSHTAELSAGTADTLTCITCILLTQHLADA